MKESPTERWIRQAQNGDAEAYDRLFAHLADRLLMYIRVRLGRGLRQRLDSI